MQTALIVGVPHPNARNAIQDAIDIAHHLLDQGMTVTLITDEAATPANVFSCKADICWFTGECIPTGRLQLHDGTIAPQLLALGKQLTVFDCCHIGNLVRSTGTSRVLCAAAGKNWNESDGSSLFMHAVREIMQDSSPLIDRRAPYLPVETFRHIATWMSTWCDRNNPTQRQAPVMGWI